MRSSTPAANRRVRCSVFIAAILLTASPQAEAGRGRSQNKAVAEAGLRPPKARVTRELSIREVFMLRVGFRLAFERVRELPECAALFNGLELNGPTSLALTTYTAPQEAAERAVCERGAIAVTRAGQLRIRICPSLLNLAKEGVAAILIPEALHAAGLGEWPVDPDGPTSGDITRAVLEACALS